ncbi:MAG: hypothetical protein GWM92_20510 [Gemmatimonadetes bacterium]|nr:hypothetical protein [Gemmatimonadota bacterium]NIR81221.1 hypothetical protein [Gemmatimonadota bacterium]NIT90066.1 hypothetical protein [Gemmatimonadota bacterium]NIU33878.1 hypothetical protein [Gemmatimonadota bacterium]NIU38070.1 hypothetical protein [Gemmatimonadota bacterium]
MKTHSLPLPGRVLLALSLLGLAAACASSSRSEGESPYAGDRPVVVQIQNRNFFDLLVFADSRAGQRRLGYVTGKGEEIFRIDPAFAVDELRIRVREMERGRECSQHYPGAPGQVIRIVVTETFARSQICF